MLDRKLMEMWAIKERIDRGVATYKERDKFAKFGNKMYEQLCEEKGAEYDGPICTADVPLPKWEPVEEE